jgi:hypothetical protein
VCIIGNTADGQATQDTEDDVFTIVVLKDGQVYCRGQPLLCNPNGASTTMYQVPLGNNVTKIACGPANDLMRAICALLVDGSLKCWGKTVSIS